MRIAKVRETKTESKVGSIRSVVALPAVELGEAVCEYVTAVKSDSPIEYFTIFGMNFEKKVLPNEASLLENQAKYFEYGVLSRQLTERQVEAIQNRAKEIFLRYRDKTTGRLQEVSMFSIMILKKIGEIGEYNLGVIQPAAVSEEVDPLEPVGNVRDELYKAQRRERKEK